MTKIFLIYEATAFLLNCWLVIDIMSGVAKRSRKLFPNKKVRTMDLCENLPEIVLILLTSLCPFVNLINAWIMYTYKDEIIEEIVFYS